ncbi:MAG TPA: histidine kinase [Gemmatimonadaceae bacterium]|nr:histidine kinase [Gemmatimonadaceae bacterium]
MPESRISATRRAVAFATYVGVWTAIGVVFAVQSVITYSYGGTRTVSVARLLAFSLADWYVWALLAPGILWLTRRFNFTRHPWRSLAVHLPATIAFLVARMQLRLVVGVVIPAVRMGSAGILASMALQVFVYWAIVAVAVALEYQRMYRDEQLAAVGLKTQLAHAQLGLLKMQLQPHFLFNTLNAISEQVHADPEGAERMITHLSELLRHTIGSAEAQEISLGEELALLERYLVIQRARFAGRLEVTLDVDAGAMEALVPNLVLQPLVENAIRHGIAPRATGGQVEVIARRDLKKQQLLLEVRDDGIGLDAARARRHPESAHREGVGIPNTTSRLRQLYGTNYVFTLQGRVTGGTVASLTLPLHDTVARHQNDVTPGLPRPNGGVLHGA